MTLTRVRKYTFFSAQVLWSIYCTFQSTARQRDCRLSSESETISATRGRLGPSEKYLCSVVVSATVWKWQKGLWVFTKWRAILHTGMVLGKSCPLASVTSDGYGGWCCGGPLQFDDNLGATAKILTYLLPRRAGTLDYKTGLYDPRQDSVLTLRTSGTILRLSRRGDLIVES